jgi:hypothetical protein
VRTDGNRVAAMLCALVRFRPELTGTNIHFSATRMCGESRRTDYRFAAAMSHDFAPDPQGKRWRKQSLAIGMDRMPRNF